MRCAMATQFWELQKRLMPCLLRSWYSARESSCTSVWKLGRYHPLARWMAGRLGTNNAGPRSIQPNWKWSRKRLQQSWDSHFSPPYHRPKQNSKQHQKLDTARVSGKGGCKQCFCAAKLVHVHRIANHATLTWRSWPTGRKSWRPPILERISERSGAGDNTAELTEYEKSKSVVIFGCISAVCINNAQWGNHDHPVTTVE